jgi:hypothetical protein
MELLELGWALFQGCGCFLEVMAVGSNAGAGYSAVRAVKLRRRRKDAEKSGEAAPAHNPWLWVALALACASVFFLGLVIFKHTAAPASR